MSFPTKLYEAIALENEKLAEELKSGILIVAEFVKERKRIITGGMAIDLLLREKGDKLYPDELNAFPDIDVMTPDNITDVQDLAQILHEKGYSNVSAISGMHITTRRCRIDNRVVCDLGYVPKNLYKRIPFIELKNGYRVIDPLYQRMDQHMLMSKLFTDPPNEAYQNRLKKDITRYNILDEFYPIDCKPGKIKLERVKIPSDFYPIVKENKAPSYIHGYAAYAVLIESAKKLMGDAWMKVKLDPSVVIAGAEFKNDELIFESPCKTIHLLIDISDDLKAPRGSKNYEELIDLIPNKWVLGDIEMWRFTGILISVGIGSVSGQEIIVPSIQYVMMFLLTMYFFGDEEMKNTNLQLYCSLKKLLTYLEPFYSADARKSPFFIPVQTIGTINLSLSNMIILMRIKNNIGEREPDLDTIPPNYWAGQSRLTENFDYESCKYFRKGGRLID